VALSKPDLIVMPRRRSPAHRRPAVRGRLHAIASATALLAAFAFGAPAQAGQLMKQVFDIEARHGNDPSEIIDELRPLEAAARASGGDDLRAFLATPTPPPTNPPWPMRPSKSSPTSASAPVTRARSRPPMP
jgi:hypothetical protein